MAKTRTNVVHNKVLINCILAHAKTYTWKRHLQDFLQLPNSMPPSLRTTHVFGSAANFSVVEYLHRIPQLEAKLASLINATCKASFICATPSESIAHHKDKIKARHPCTCTQELCQSELEDSPRVQYTKTKWKTWHCTSSIAVSTAPPQATTTRSRERWSRHAPLVHIIAIEPHWTFIWSVRALM